MSIESKTKDSFTPLHLSSQEGHPPIVEYHFSHDANIESKRNQDLTPLHTALLICHISIVKYLIS